MNVTVEATAGHGLDFQGSVLWEDWGFVGLGLLGLYPMSELLHRQPVWAGAWDASDSGSFLLPHFLTQPVLPRGEGNGRAEEGCLARPPVQPGLGTLPKAPETMPGTKAGLARGGPGERRELCPPHSQFWPPHRPTAPSLSLLGSLPCSRLLVTHPLALQAMLSSQKASLLPSPILTPEGRVCVSVGISAYLSVLCECVYMSV